MIPIKDEVDYLNIHDTRNYSRIMIVGIITNSLSQELYDEKSQDCWILSE